MGRSVAGAKPCSHFKYWFNLFARATGRGQSIRRLANSDERFLKIDPDVVGECLERRNVQNRHAIPKFTALGVAEEPVDSPHERGERLAATGGRAQKHVVAGRCVALGNHWPSQGLRGRGDAEAFGEPGADRGMKRVEH